MWDSPQYYEVIEGLEPGEQVIVSGYEAYKTSATLAGKSRRFGVFPFHL